MGAGSGSVARTSVGGSVGRSLLARIRAVGADPHDDEITRLTKSVFVGAAVVGVPLSFGYAVALAAVGEPLTGLVIATNGVGALLSVLILKTHPSRFLLAGSIAAISVLFAATIRPVTLGVYPNSATSVLWGILAPIAILVIDHRFAPVGFGAYLVGVVFVLVGAPLLHPNSTLAPGLQDLLTLGDLVVPSSIAAIVIALALRERRLLQGRADTLLDAILPREVARALKRTPGVIAERFDAASVLFADVVGFTPLSASLGPEELVGLLDEVFSDFDAIVDRASLEKIKTVGDTYMVAAGVPVPRPDHAPAIVRVALEMQAATARRTSGGHRLTFRFGINSGPVVAGVIGRRKFSYDLWGDTVNTASRMESHGTPGAIQITRATRELLADEFQVEPLGTIEVKGKGPMEAWRVIGPAR
ncbi:MAG: adenylate/guanylate cyclase domain-containing protein [Candidatus Limnocylindrales bacterium]